MKTSIMSMRRAAGILLCALFLLPGCGGDGGLQQLVIPSDNDAGASQRPQVTLHVSNGAGVSGDVVITLLPEYAPKTVANFLTYVAEGYYNNTIFHRHEPGFVMQGGGYASPVAKTDSPMHKTPTHPPVQLEVKVSNVLATVAMARTSNPNSATTEFFINLDDNSFLDTSAGGYAAFGYIKDFTTVNAMAQAPCEMDAVVNTGLGQSCLPVPNLVITSAAVTRH
jgi:cyclophilin family peptidyl-prolyl cis-trans isomerase